MSIKDQIKAEIEQKQKAMRVLDEHTMPEQMSKTCAIFQYSDAILSELLSFIDSLPKETSEDLEKAAEEWARFYDQGTCDGIAQDCFIAGANWQKERFVKLLDQWEEHAIRGMKKGAVAYHQGKVALIIDLKDSLKEDEK